MLGARVMVSAPEVAPGGMVALIVVLLQEVTVSGAPLSSAPLLPWDAPKLERGRVAARPIDTVVAEIALMLGTRAAVEVMETLSKAAVASPEVEPLFSARPT